MNANPSHRLDFSRPISRATLLELLKTGLNTGEYRFTRQAALAWLAAYPEDLQVSLDLARSLAGEGRNNQAIPILESLVRADPEFVDAQELLDAIRGDPPISNDQRRQAHLITHKDEANPPVIEWCAYLRAGQKSLDREHLEQAQKLAESAIKADPGSPLPAIYQVQVAYSNNDMMSVQNLSELYHARWSECLQFSLYLAEARMTNGDESGAVELLHQCVSHDAAGQVPTRIWGRNHPYRPLWLEKMSFYFDQPIPAAVAAVFGWNQLQAGSPVTSDLGADDQPIEAEIELTQPTRKYTGEADTPLDEEGGEEVTRATHFKGDSETLHTVQAEFERLAKRIRRPSVGRADGRFPMYVIFTSRKALERLYGEHTANILDDLMKQLASAVRKRPGWGALVYTPDEPNCCALFGTKPVTGSDPWKLKLSLRDLDNALWKRGEMIGALLIVGGPEIVPFHRLPNPTDDSDLEVESDNPYASADDNYFVPEWGVGRLPGEHGTDAGLLLERLRAMIVYHNDQRFARPWWQRLPVIGKMMRGVKNSVKQKGKRMRPSFGYAAQAWQKSSAEVFKPIGSPRAILASPPNHTGNAWRGNRMPSRLGYYNLHGIRDAVEWFGQKNADDTSDTPDYPVALSLKDIENSLHAPRIIFSEACYGGFINHKRIDEALSLKFLSCGTLAMVGSTGIAYGAVASPLTAADLLGQVFWQKLKGGHLAGNALRMAKIALAREMTKRQGYLDGEDQKTLLSFVLYGDPLASLEGAGVEAKTIFRPRTRKPLVVVSDDRDDNSAETLPAEMLEQVRQTVAHYLPGLSDAELSVSPQTGGTRKDSKTTTARTRSADERTVVTLSKQVRVSKQVHTHYARLTLDGSGKVVKMSSSR